MGLLQALPLNRIQVTEDATLETLYFRVLGLRLFVFC